jgi:RNA polymerase sigma-70 factor, ECF subfamily
VADSATTHNTSLEQQLEASAATSERLCPLEPPFAWVLARARLRDPEAFSLLYDRFLPMVYRFVLTRVHDVPEAEDLTSETFFAVLGGIDALHAQDELGFASWVLGIARYQVAQYYRHLKVHLETLTNLSHQEEPIAVAEEGDPLAVITARERWTEVVAALNRLTQEQRMVILHRCLLGTSAEEVGKLMGKPPNAIYGLQFRALASLARHLGIAEQKAATGPSTDNMRSQERRADHAPGRDAPGRGA